MTVRIRPISMTGGAPPITFFSDTFNRSSPGGSGLGPDWAGGVSLNTPLVNPPGLPTWGLAAISGGGNGLVFGSSTSTYNPATQFIGFLQPVVYTRSLVSGKSQFCQITLNSASSVANSVEAGPSVFTDSLANGGYAVRVASDKSFLFQAIRNSLPDVTFASGGAGSIANGDILRVEVIAGSPNTVRFLKNGVLQNSSTDSNFTTGFPGIACSVSGQTNTPISEWKNFSGGLL